MTLPRPAQNSNTLATCDSASGGQRRTVRLANGRNPANCCASSTMIMAYVRAHLKPGIRTGRCAIAFNSIKMRLAVHGHFGSKTEPKKPKHKSANMQDTQIG